MFTIKPAKSGLRKLNNVPVSPMLAQVRKMLTSADQRLILMVRG